MTGIQGIYQNGEPGLTCYKTGGCDDIGSKGDGEEIPECQGNRDAQSPVTEASDEADEATRDGKEPNGLR
jgi:hypothetical protein